MAKLDDCLGKANFPKIYVDQIKSLAERHALKLGQDAGAKLAVEEITNDVSAELRQMVEQLGGNWTALYGEIDSAAAPADSAARNERDGSTGSTRNAGERNAGTAGERAQEPQAGSGTPENGVPAGSMESGQRGGTGAESQSGQPGGSGSRGSGVGDGGQGGQSMGQSSAGETGQPSGGGEVSQSGKRGGKRPATNAGTNPADGNAGLNPDERNHRIAPDDTLIPGGDISKARANLSALKLLKSLETENRNATPEEKKVLAQYVGWGGLPNVFNDGTAALREKAKRGQYLFEDQRTELASWEKKWGKLYDEAKSLMTDGERAAASRSTLNAHYTSREVIEPMWALARHLGFTGGRALETSMGIGHFLGLQPADLAEKTKWRGVELDDVTGRLAKKLYPQAQIQVTGFQDAKIPNHSVDLVIGNFPFAKAGPNDERYPRFSLHNYFFARAIDTLKPGGLIVAISTSSTLDNEASRAAREWLSERADLVGAMRLPNTAFKKNAGTEVTTDIVVLRKRGVGSFAQGQNWLNTQEIPTYNGKGMVSVNEYFARNPEMMLGRMSLEGIMYGGNEPALLPNPNQDLTADITAAIAKMPANVVGDIGENKDVAAEETSAAGEQAVGKEGSVVVKDGKPYQIDQGVLKVPAWAISTTKAGTAKSFVTLRDHLKDLIAKMASESATDAEISAGREKLNELYDRHVKKYGALNARPHAFLEDDPELPLVQALEDVKNVAKEIVVQSGAKKGEKRQVFEKEYSKATIFSKRTIFPRTEPATADTIQDAITQSLGYRNGIDVSYIAKLRGITDEEAEAQLLAEPGVYRNPKLGNFETADSYLSGFVREKLKEAKRAAEEDEAYKKNVEALEKNQPEWIPMESISYKLGSSWLPPSLIEQFLADKLEVTANVSYIPETGHWKVMPIRGQTGAVNTTTYATEYFDGHDLVDDALNLKSPVAKDMVGDPAKPVKNEKETVIAQQRLSEIQDLFRAYVAQRTDVHESLERTYNDRFNGVRLREFSGPKWDYYPNASTEIKLRQHQKDVTARILQESTLLAHSVGTGKTFIMITAAMEMRRLGMAKKPMIVAQNATTLQFAASFKRLYPTARILVPNRKQREASNRQKLMSQIATGEYDAIIIPQSFLNQLPDDPERMKGFVNAELAELKSARISAAHAEGNNSPRVKDLEKAMDRLEERLQKLLARKTDDTVTFEQLGIDALFVDEAHAYKKLEFATQMDNIKGLDKGASERGLGLYMKTRWIQEKNAGKNVVLATGTPVSNTIAEAWNMLRFVRPDLLEKYDVEKFDSFASTFGDTITNLEQTAGGTFKSVTRFAKYINGPELISLFHSAADVVLKEDINLPGLPALKNGEPTTVKIALTPRLKEYIAVLRQRLENFEKMTGYEKRKNSHIPLVTFTDAKKASLDLRLIDSAMPDEPGNKLHTTVDNISRIYNESTPTAGAQLVFADLFQSPDGVFNLYHTMRDELVKKGIPFEQIAIINEAKTDAARERIFDAVKAGTIRVMFGSTEKMGVGVNVQDKLIALHHMDAPHRPMDVEQRNGRIVRQGNENPIVEILNYGVENTLDATLYQRLAIKQKFINQIMRGDITGRTFEDAADEVSMTFEEQMAAFSGNPLAMKKVTAEGEVRRLEALKQGHIRQIAQTRTKLASAKEDLTRQQAYLPKLEKAAEIGSSAFSGETTGEVVGRKFADRKSLVEGLEAQFAKAISDGRESIGDQLSPNDWEFNAGSVAINGIPLSVTLRIPTDRKGKVDPSRQPMFLYRGMVDKISMDGWVETGTGLLSSVASQVKNLPNKVEDQKGIIKRTERDITEMTGFLTVPFHQEKELTKAHEELARIEAELARPSSDSNPSSPTPQSDDPNTTLGTPPVKLTPEEQRIQGESFVSTLEDKRTLAEKAKDYFDDLRNYVATELRQKVLDAFDSLRRLEREAYGTNANLDATVSPYKQARITRGLPEMMKVLMENSQLEWKDGSVQPKAGTKGLFQILKPLEQSGLLRLWENYVAAKRADGLLKEGREKNFGKHQDPKTGEWLWDAALAKQKIDERLALATAHPEFETIRQEYVAFQKSLLDFAEKGGLINADQRARWESMDYVPFYRIAEEVDGAKGPGKRRGIANQRSGIRRLKGGSGSVAIIENMVMNAESLLNAAVKNNAMRLVADLAENSNDMLVRIPYKAVPFKASVPEVIRKLSDAGVDTSGLTAEEADEFVKFWRMQAPKGKDVVSVMVDGKPIYYRVKDPALLRSVVAMGPRSHAAWMRLLMAPKNTLTKLVTLDPAFMAANTIRDSFSAWVIADSPIRPGLDAATGFLKSLRDDPNKIAMMAAGGGSGHYNAVSQRAEVRKYLRQLTPAAQKSFRDSIIDTAGKAMRAYEELGRASENANRIPVFESALNLGASPAEAAFQARDLMDFAARGDSALLGFFLDTVPFLNARIQGLYKLGRASGIGQGTGITKYLPHGKHATYGAIIGGATLALLALHWDDDRYWALPEWDRDIYWHFWLGDQHLRIPKPFEVGQIFGTVPERMFEFLGKTGDGELLAKRMGAMISDTFVMNPLPQALKPVAERAMNMNTFTQRPIISRGDEYKQPEQQFNVLTSETMRELANAMPDSAPAWLRSPKTLEHFVRGYFGSLGMYALTGADAITRAATGAPEDPEVAPGDWWVMKRFAPSSDLRETKYVSQFYDLHKEATGLVRQIKELQKTDAAAARTLQADNRDMVNYAPRAEATYDYLTALRKQEQSIYNSGETPEEKRRRLAEITQKRNAITQRAVQTAPRRSTPIFNPFDN